MPYILDLSRVKYKWKQWESDSSSVKLAQSGNKQGSGPEAWRAPTYKNQPEEHTDKEKVRTKSQEDHLIKRKKNRRKVYQGEFRQALSLTSRTRGCP